MEEELIILKKQDLTDLIVAVKELLNQLQNQNNTNLNSDWLDPQDAMHLLKVSNRTLHNWKKKGFLKHSKIDGKLYFKKSQIEELLENSMQDI